jgi:hypothetical protein
MTSRATYARPCRIETQDGDPGGAGNVPGYVVKGDAAVRHSHRARRVCGARGEHGEGVHGCAVAAASPGLPEGVHGCPGDHPWRRAR